MLELGLINFNKIMTKIKKGSQRYNQNLERQKFLRSNGVNVKLDGSWGPWQQKQYDNLKSENKQNWFTKAMIGTAMAENPAVMTASGWKQDREGNWKQERTTESDQLADNLATISWFSPTHPGTALIDVVTNRAVFPIVGKGISSLTNYYDGHLGYYTSNRLFNTIARRLRLPSGAQHPELIRKINFKDGLKFDSNDKLIVSDQSVQQEFLKGRTNFTIDRPVVSHSKGSWDSADALIIDPKVLNGRTVKSIEPSDFIVEGSFHVNPNQVTLVSGNPQLLSQARNHKIATLTSSKLQQLYKDMQQWQANYNKSSIIEQFKMGKLNRTPIAKKYASEIQRLQSLRGTPTMKDIKFIEIYMN